MKIFNFAVMAGLSLVAWSCNKNGNVDVPENETETEETEVVVPAGPRAPIVMTKGMQEVNDRSIDFSLALFNKVAAGADKKNVLIAPFSITGALSMVAQGAANETYNEMTSVLGFGGLQRSDIGSYFGTLTEALTSADPSVKLAVANSAWNQKGLTLKSSYIDALKNSFKAEIRPLTDAAAVNEWVKDKTNGLIEKLVNESISDSMLLLVNALYFKGTWTNPFDAKNSKSGRFENADGTKSNVVYMNSHEISSAYSDENVSALTLPFGNMTYMITLIKPEKDVDNAIKALDRNYLDNIIAGNGQYNVDLALPKMDISYKDESDIKKALIELGINQAFTPFADFSEISESTDLCISDVIHATNMKLDEKGAEAAGATAIGMIATSAGPGGQPIPTLDMKLTRPYIYAITEYSTGAILFIGVQNKF